MNRHFDLFKCIFVYLNDKRIRCKYRKIKVRIKSYNIIFKLNTYKNIYFRNIKIQMRNLLKIL